MSLVHSMRLLTAVGRPLLAAPRASWTLLLAPRFLRASPAATATARAAVPRALTLPATMASPLLPRLQSTVAALANLAVWLIKRTFQPSLVKRKRRMGYFVRQRTPGGRNVLKRRRAKGRARLDGGI